MDLYSGSFFADVSIPATLNQEREVIFADDLNIFKYFPRDATDDFICDEFSKTSQRVHKWGRLNRVSFDPQKESLIVVHPDRGTDDSFKLLGIRYDCQLRMASDIDDILARARPKIRALLRTRSFYSTAELVIQFKTHIWGIVEYHTPAVFNCKVNIFNKIDHLQNVFLMKLKGTEEEGLLT